jgi:hypothetical protein
MRRGAGELLAALSEQWGAVWAAPVRAVSSALQLRWSYPLHFHGADRSTAALALAFDAAARGFALAFLASPEHLALVTLGSDRSASGALLALPGRLRDLCFFDARELALLCDHAPAAGERAPRTVLGLTELAAPPRQPLQLALGGGARPRAPGSLAEAARRLQPVPLEWTRHRVMADGHATWLSTCAARNVGAVTFGRNCVVLLDMAAGEDEEEEEEEEEKDD